MTQSNDKSRSEIEVRHYHKNQKKQKKKKKRYKPKNDEYTSEETAVTFTDLFRCASANIYFQTCEYKDYHDLLLLSVFEGICISKLVFEILG